jgi:hypothetical protein
MTHRWRSSAGLIRSTATLACPPRFPYAIAPAGHLRAIVRGKRKYDLEPRAVVRASCSAHDKLEEEGGLLMVVGGVVPESERQGSWIGHMLHVLGRPVLKFRSDVHRHSLANLAPKPTGGLRFEDRERVLLPKINRVFVEWRPQKRHDLPQRARAPQIA